MPIGGVTPPAGSTPAPLHMAVGLHGTFYGYDQQPIDNGQVTFTPLGGWTPEASTNRDYAPRKVVAQLQDGEFMVTLVTPDSGTEPLKYQVDTKFGPDLTTSFVITLPINPPGDVVLELTDRDEDGVLSALPGGGDSDEGVFGSGGTFG